ncbi:hypothetical protein RCH14_004479 [Massilia sp. MP_M2]|uniref:hypothetical protein n=1 Tax=Massilia sp. MP_M2 TaxID=3071713 RepID=UPI00319E79F2
MTSTPVIDQKHAEEVTHRHANPGSTVRFEQHIKGWSGSGFDASFRMTEGTFFESAQCATITFECVNIKNGRNLRGGLGSISLTSDDAIKLARAIVPKEIADAIDAAVAASKT